MTAVKYDNSPVRRQDRLLEEEHAAELLRSGEYGFLALGGGRGGYGVPVNYAAEGSRIYIHCAPEGEKLRRIGQDAQAVFCVVGRTAPQPERFTTEYESIMASGVVSVVSDDGERMRALSLIVEKYSPGYEEQGAVYEILLSHRNNHYEQYTQARVDLTLAGHAHGGLIRLPGTDGLVGPKRELFPQYTAGLYDLSYGQMVVSRGLGNQFPCFRLLNRPDVPLVVLG